MSTSLFSEFKALSDQEWKEAIIKTLKGKPYESLLWNTDEGIEVKPFYTKSDITELSDIPGSIPYNRGNKEVSNAWKIRVDFSKKSTSEEIVQQLVNGVNSIGVAEDISIENGLKNVELDYIDINVRTHDLSQSFNQYKVLEQNLTGAFEYDLYTKLTLQGESLTVDEKSQFVNLQKGIQSKFPLMRSALVSGNYFKEAGANIVEEVAFILAQGNEYLNLLTEGGLSIDDASARIQINTSIGSNYFFEVAKIRAIRRLWALLIKQYQPSENCTSNVFINATTSLYNKSVKDKYNNMLRQTTETMASILGGVDSVSVLNFDATSKEDSSFSKRIARNIQLLLLEESYFDKMVDPAGGSYYIESLTDEIAEKAWEIFKSIEKEGGFEISFANGTIQNMLEESANKKLVSYKENKSILLGVNKYPNGMEELEDSFIQVLTETRDGAFKALKFIHIESYLDSINR